MGGGEGGGTDGWMLDVWMDEEIYRTAPHKALSPLLVLLKAGLDTGQVQCAGTGEHSHTLGSQSPHRSLKIQQEEKRVVCTFSSWG